MTAYLINGHALYAANSPEEAEKTFLADTLGPAPDGGVVVGEVDEIVEVDRAMPYMDESDPGDPLVTTVGKVLDDLPDTLPIRIGRLH